MSRRIPEPIEIKILNLTEKGEGYAVHERPESNNPRDQKTWHVFVFGALPGETVRVQPIKKRRGIVKARLLEIIEPTSARIAPREEHFTSCSAWQILAYPDQLQYKQEIVIKYFNKRLKTDVLMGKNILQNLEVTPSPVEWHYRNKMEFSFETLEDGTMSLALHKRGSHNQFWCFEECVIAHEKINQVAGLVLTEINRARMTFHDLKNLVVRYSYLEDKTLAMLYVKREDLPELDISDPDIKGFKMIYSDPRSPATIETKVLQSVGDDFLTEKILDQKLSYRYDSFFQNNPQAFENLVQYIDEHIEESPDKTLLDLYGGVGTFGLLLAHKFNQVISLEINEGASEIGRTNAEENNVGNIDFVSSPAEKIDLAKYFQTGDVLLVDPPRSGLHPKVIKQIVESGPRDFIYISCNPQTQIDDFVELRKSYKITKWRLFDLYPQTPHVESVFVCERV